MTGITPDLPVFDSASTVTGLDFMVRSLIRMEANGTVLKPEDVTAGMTDEQKDIFMARLRFHRSRQQQKRP
ncbi:hypothetical protein ELZ88_24345 (plasmid) [Salmonella enterica subsp. enterica serovar Karamoja]|uniref:Uncharacterized protein n=1 Tax=Salmonella enterica subsp. enterica serovar Karamoja TaxID=2500153 RepID=A0A3Q9MTE4_SALET|nr:hypothetical protein [Salmonella enterica]AZT39664.1 hypothetical protein ELZ88_24345 [Salmonella enterica subsp. enterica serovar Karamoja]AZT44436.1 hypothetical protein EL007_24595 [Salmonella enterica subsp. enterica serovar Karamoja]